MQKYNFTQPQIYIHSNIFGDTNAKAWAPVSRHCQLIANQAWHAAALQYAIFHISTTTNTKLNNTDKNVQLHKQSDFPN